VTGVPHGRGDATEDAPTVFIAHSFVALAIECATLEAN
jgi:hypothetical protein